MSTERKIKPYEMQEEKARQALAILAKHKLVYLAMEERTGKTLTALLVAEQHPKIKSVLVITKKAALKGWHKTIDAYKPNLRITVINYHKASQVFDKFDLIILDEAHNYIAAYPKIGKLWSQVQRHTSCKPIIYISATPYAQGPQQLYHQFHLSCWSPWKDYTTFYMWFKEFGIPETKWISGRQIPIYTKCKPNTLDTVKHLFVTGTRAEMDFAYEPEDKVHYVELSEKTKQAYNILIKKKAIVLNGHELVCDTVSKLRATLHMLEGGTFLISKASKTRNGTPKVIREYFVLGNTEKIDYIKEHWGDSPNVVIMYNFKAEKLKLEQHFKQATLLQATTFAEGIDLYEYDHLIIYSQDYSTARHTQRRARQANHKRDKPIVVHYLLVKKAISDQVYTTVCKNKRNYVDSLYRGELL